MALKISQRYAAVKKYALAHKVLSAVVIVVVLGGGWWVYAKVTAPAAQTRYILGSVTNGTIVASVAESGQISTTNSLNITPQVSGTITWVGVKAGQVVRAGQALATIDDTDALQTLNSAKATLVTDQLSYEQATAQAPINYQNDITTLSTAQENLQNDYNNTYNDLSNTYLDLPAVMTGAQDALYGYDFDVKRSQWNMDVLYNLFSSFGPQQLASLSGFRDNAKADYATATAEYSTATAAYNLTSRTSSTDTTDATLAQSITMTTGVAQALQSELNFYGAVSDLAKSTTINLPSNFSTIQSSARSNLSTVNGDLSTLLADKKTLDTDKQAIVKDQQTITLDQVGSPDGTNPISLQVSANNIKQEEQNIATQEADLADYTIVAPFAGTLSAVSAQVGDSASGAVATIITNTEIADLSVNEVDASKINLGQKATLTFDAIPNLTLTGTVAEINPVGTVSQGVVSYDVQISFDIQNSQVKSGMTVNATIQTDVAQNVLVVPSSAIKTEGPASYVQVFNPAIASSTVVVAGTQGVLTTEVPQSVPVTVGISDNTSVQITSGLTAGEQIVTRTTTSTGTAAPAAAATTGGAARAGGFGGGGGGGGAIRL